LAPGDGVAVLLHVKLQRGLQLTAGCVKTGAGERHADADFERVSAATRRANNPATAVAAIPSSTVRRRIFPPSNYSLTSLRGA
jgi:hypothetical protein